MAVSAASGDSQFPPATTRRVRNAMAFARGAGSALRWL
jgi:hypothetical protein